MRPDPAAWTMYGGGGERNNLARESISPPLERVWEYDAAGGFSTDNAVTADSIIFAANVIGEVHAIHVRTGEGKGVFDFGTGLVGAPIIQNGFLYAALTRDEKNLISYDLATGSVVWRTAVGDVESSPLFRAGKLYVTTLHGKLHCVEAIHGVIEWTYELPKGIRTRMIHSSPAMDEDIIIFGTDAASVIAVGTDGVLRWTASTGGPVIASPSIHAGKVFVGCLDGMYYCLNLKDGSLIWKRSLGSQIFASQAVDSTQVYVGTSGGVFYGLDQKTGDVQWQTKVKSVIAAAPLVSGDVVYVGCNDRTLHAYRTATGEQLWEYAANGRIRTVPLAAKGYLIVCSDDRVVMGFRELKQ